MTPADIKYIVVHCSASPPNVFVDASVIDSWHRKRGFLRIGYHFVILTTGEVQVGRKLNEVGAHASGYNAESIGICLAGGINPAGKPADNFSPNQKVALADLIQKLRVSHGMAAAEVLGHRDLPDVRKDCPCFDVRKWWKAANTF